MDTNFPAVGLLASHEGNHQAKQVSPCTAQACGGDPTHWEGSRGLPSQGGLHGSPGVTHAL